MRAALAGLLFLALAPRADAQFVGLLRPAEITVGFAVMKPCPGAPWPCTPLLVPYPSLNVSSDTGTAHWLAKDTSGLLSDGTVSVVWDDTGTNGGRSGGVFAKLKQTGPKSKALRCLAYDQKNTDYLKLETIEWTTATGVVTAVVPIRPWLNLNGTILRYAGSDTPKADCECRLDLKCHGYCAVVRVELTTETLEAGVRYTCRAYALGAGAPGNGRHYDPFDPTETLLGTVTYEGPPPANLATDLAEVGIAAANVQGVIRSSFQHFTAEP